MITPAATTDSYAARRLDELPELWDGFARLVRAGLGITAFGAQIMQLPPDYTTESHDEADTGQQELYVALAGAGAVVIRHERLPLDPDHLVRVDAGTGRVLTSGPDGLRVLCIGATPGCPYEAPPWTAAAGGEGRDEDSGDRSDDRDQDQLARKPGSERRGHEEPDSRTGERADEP